MRHALRFILITLALVLLGLALAPRAVPAQAAGPCDSLPYVTTVQIGPPVDCGDCVPGICPGAPIPVRLAGWFPDGCHRFRGLELVAGPEAGPLPAPPIVRIRVDRAVCTMCTMALVPWSADTVLRGLPGGEYALRLELVRTDFCNDVPVDTLSCREARAFAVRESCGVSPPPGPLPFVDRVRIGPAPACDSCPPRICPGEPVPVALAGTLPSNCYRFLGLELLPDPAAGPRPAPPVLRVVVAENDCMDYACDDIERPWAARTLLPGLPAGTYELPLQLALVGMCDTTNVLALFGDRRAFTVLDSCVGPPAGPCVLADWAHSGTACDDFIVPGGRAKVVMTAQSSVPLAGLQGRIRVWPRGLLIAGLEPVGRASGMHVVWERTGEGADFVMFAEQGAPIGGLRCDTGSRCIEPVLAVAMVPDTDAVLPAVSHVTVGDLLGADSLGGAVPGCQIATLVVVEARVCARPSCDFNLDGRLDVRDLVAMVRCVLGNAVCPDTVLARLDCNRDGQVGLDDVLCCARAILRGGERDGTPGRAEPNVAVAFGEPAWETGGLRVPVRIRGAERIGAARLALALPLDRYDVTGVETGAGNPQWLALHETVDGQAVIGLVGLGPDLPTEQAELLELTLHLAPRSGAPAGGEVGLADLQASGRDGVTLELSTSPASVPLPLPAVTALTARPNPFTGTTRLALALERGAAVDVTVHDLGGRRVTTLFHGALPAGLHEFAWSGVWADGARAAHGVYFVQARVDGERLTRKLVLLRGE